MAGSLLQQPASDAKKKLTEFAKDDNNVPVFSENEDRTWYRGEISSIKWNQSFPYQLRILVAEGEGRYALAPVKGAVFTLPIPPESLTVSMPFAIQTSVTLGGTIEEHNGAPTRIITMQGTTGVAFGREPAKTAPPISLAEAVFAGTVSNFNATRAALAQLTTSTSTTNTVPAADFDDPAKQGKLTGYHQMRILQAFLETYVELKKSGPAGRKYRLAFCMWKDEAVYLVAPMGNFEVRRSAASPLEYMYSLTLKATKRISLERNSVTDLGHQYVPLQRDPNKLALFLNTVQKAREVLQGARKTLAAIGGDVATTLNETSRELALFAKDALNVPITLADLPNTLKKETKQAWTRAKQDGKDIGDQATAVGRAFEQAWGQLSGEANDDVSTDVDRDPHPFNSFFEDPDDSYEVFSTLSIGDLNLPPATVSKIADERERVRTLTRLDFEERRDAVAGALVDFSRFLGLGDVTYESTYGLEPLETTAVDSPADEDYDVIFAMNQLLTEMNRLVVTNENEPQQKLDVLATVAGLAERSGIAFRMPRSKYAVPFPYGSTLEMLAGRYLGDPNRWHEIAALNGLQSPFVDEEGFDLPLLVNGNANSVLVDSATRLFVGQPVWVSSTATMRTKRRVRKIQKLTPGQWLITLDGEPDLHRFTVLASATLHAFTPNTVNSQQLIYIPSDIEPRDDDFKTKKIAGVEEADSLVAVGGIDLLLTPTNDLVLSPDGDTKWAVGLTNISQKVRIAFSVRKGTLNQHPEFGMPVEPGTSIADLEAVDIVRSIETMFKGDPSFNGIRAARVNIDGPISRVAVAIEARGVDQVIPVAVEIRQ